MSNTNILNINSNNLPSYILYNKDLDINTNQLSDFIKEEIGKVNEYYKEYFHTKIKDIINIINYELENELFIKNYIMKMVLLAFFINKNSKKYNIKVINRIIKFDYQIYFEEIENITNIFYMYLLNKLLNNDYKVTEAIKIVKQHLLLRNHSNKNFNRNTNTKYKNKLNNQNKKIINKIQNENNKQYLNTSFNLTEQKKTTFVRQNTEVHYNLFGNCFMFSDFSLINNIKNNILNNKKWENINIEADNNLMILLFIIYYLYYINNNILFLKMLHKLSNSNKDLLPINYNKDINKLINSTIDEQYKIINESEIPAICKYKIFEFLKNLNKINYIKNIKIDNNILDNFIKKISFLTKFTLYTLYNNIKVSDNMDMINFYQNFEIIDKLLYEVLKTKQFISIGFFAKSDELNKIIGKKIIKNNNKREIIQVFQKRNVMNDSPDGHAIVITDIMKDEKGEPKLLNNRYIYKFKNNWGSFWYDGGYGYLTLDSFYISYISFFIDDKNKYKIDNIIYNIKK